MHALFHKRVFRHGRASQPRAGGRLANLVDRLHNSDGNFLQNRVPRASRVSATRHILSRLRFRGRSVCAESAFAQPYRFCPTCVCKMEMVLPAPRLRIRSVFDAAAFTRFAHFRRRRRHRANPHGYRENRRIPPRFHRFKI